MYEQDPEDWNDDEVYAPFMNPKSFHEGHEVHEETEYLQYGQGNNVVVHSNHFEAPQKAGPVTRTTSLNLSGASNQ